MPALFTALLTAYLLVDFVLPVDRAAGYPRFLWFLALRAGVIILASYLLLGTFHRQILLAILLTHLVMGAIRLRWPSQSVRPFLIGHFVHLVVLVGLASWYPEAARNGWWIAHLRPDLSRWYFAGLSGLSGVILCVPTGGTLIGKLVTRFTVEIGDETIAGLSQGGQYIGWLERILVMLLVLIHKPEGIGFLIAAKSILRFGEIKDASQRKVAEYIIIGTFLSFGWALLISVLTQKAVQYRVG